MRSALLLCLGFILYSLNASAALGWLKAVVVEVNSQHNTPVTLRMNGLSGSFSHSSSNQPTWPIEKSHLSQGGSTPVSIDYSGLQQGCEFKFNLYFRSGDSGPFIHLGLFDAPTGAKGALVPLGICGNHFCSSDANISRQLKANRINELKGREKSRKDRIQTKARASRNPDNRGILEVEYRRKQLDIDLRNAQQVLNNHQQQLKTSADPLVSIHIEPTEQSLLEVIGLSDESSIADGTALDLWRIAERMHELSGGQKYDVLGGKIETVDDVMRRLLWSEGLQYQSKEILDRLNPAILPPSALEMAMRLAPGLGLAVDLQETRTGTYVVGPNKGKPMTTFDHSLAIVSVVTAGYGGKLFKAAENSVLIKKLVAPLRAGAKQAGSWAEHVLSVAERLGLKESAEISRFATISKQILRSDAEGMAQLERIVDASTAVKPRLGNMFVRQLRDITKPSFVAEFEGAIFKGVLEPGDILFQAQRAGQKGPGNWFLAIKPINAQHAEELANIAKYENYADEIKVFVVKERVSSYAGKVKNGAGHQILVPKDVPLNQVLEEIIY